MKNILITGGAGFIGSNLIRFLLEESDFDGRILNVDHLTYAGNLENLSGLAELFEDRYVFIKADISDLGAMAKVFEEYPIDVICHLAAESHVDRSIVRPNAFIQTNIIGTYHLLELARLNRDHLTRFHHVSTDEVFGSLGEQGSFAEDSPYHPNSPYSASKASSDHLVRAYHQTYGLPITISNCSNNYGPYQFPEKLIPLMILNALEEKPLPVYGDGQHIRDWLYVKDHCRAIWIILKDGKNGETYNIGGNNQITNLNVVETLCDQFDELKPLKENSSHRDLITFIKDRPGHDRRYAMDFSKIKKELGWIPQESFASGIKNTLEWYLNNLDWVKHIKCGEYQTWMEEHYAGKSSLPSASSRVG